MSSALTIIKLRHSPVSRIAAMCGALLLIAAGAIGAPASGVRYADPQYGYALTAPPGWTRKTDMPRPYVAFLGPVEEGFQTNFHVEPNLTANKTLAQVVKTARETAAKSKTVRIRSERRASLAGSPAVMLESVVTLEGQPPSIARQVVAVHAGYSYTITFSVAPTALTRNLPA